jgi:DNA-binding response OmpR family regulator
LIRGGFMKKTSILIVEDEVKVASFIAQGLEENDFKVKIVHDGLEGRDEALSGRYDLIILDIGLPGMSGIDICKAVRKSNVQAPILMLSAMGTTDDKLTGFDVGADDYLVKPFEFRELLARIRALLKRTNADSENKNIIKVADLEINSDSKIVKRANKKIDLTTKEYLLLEYLARNKGKVISRADIAEKIWDINFETGTNVIDVYVNFLRKKIDRDFSPKLIYTQIGMGYILKDVDE